MGLIFFNYFSTGKFKIIYRFLASVTIFAFIYFFLFESKDFHIYKCKLNVKKKKEPIGSFKKHLMDLFNNFYFSFVIQSTVGFGDIVPKTTKARIAVIIQIFISFLIVSI